MIMHSPKVLITLLLLGISMNAEITLTGLGDATYKVWEADSIYLGLGFVAKDPSKQINVIWKMNGPKVVGCLYFMHPGIRDSSEFLFHNKIYDFPGESLSVNIGKYPAGTPMVFKYVQLEPYDIDSSAMNKKFYSGQNRAGIDDYQSDMEGTLDFRWAIAGRVNNDTCEIEFASWRSGYYQELRFFVTNVYREELEKYHVAMPVASPVKERFQDTLLVTLSTATIGTSVIYYTLDGSTPTTMSPVYNAPIVIKAFEIIKAIAAKPGDTQWVNSGIMEKTYIRDAVGISPVNSVAAINSRFGVGSKVYNIRGQLVSTGYFTNRNRDQARGIFIIQNGPKGRGTVNMRVVY
jgi:hypothetical protein